MTIEIADRSGVCQVEKVILVRSWLVLAATMFVVCLTVVDAHATEDELTADLPPVVMIVMDTSGSMAAVPEGNRRPRCSSTCARDTTDGRSQKSRSLVVKEVLTGTFESDAYYCCRQRNGGVRYEEAPDLVPQRSDGVLDIYRSDVKFAVAGFDVWRGGGSTSYGGSYGGINYGIQGEGSSLSPLVSPGASDDPEAIAALNDVLQERIRWHVPTGVTPIAAALHDAGHYFEHHPDVVSTSEGGDDPYGACRPKAVIVITDGMPTFDSCYPRCSRYPDNVYLTSELQAARLYARQGIKTYVVGFRTNASAVRTLENIAIAGGTCDAPGAGCFYEAGSYTGLRLAMDNILADVLQGTRSRTSAATTSRTGFRATETGYHEILASYEIDGDTGRWLGHLERTTWQCNENLDYAPSGDVLDYADSVAEADASARRIYVRGAEAQSLVEIDDRDAGELFRQQAPDAQVPLGATCSGDADLPLEEMSDGSTTWWEFTTEGDYLLEPFACRSDAECAPDERCDHGLCLAAGTACLVNSDCCPASVAETFDAVDMVPTDCEPHSAKAWRMCTNKTRLYVDIHIPLAGRYRWSARAFQINDDVGDARMGFRVDGQQVWQTRVSNEGPDFVEYSVEVELSAGTHRFEIRALNAAKKRDLIVEGISIVTAGDEVGDNHCDQVCIAGSCEVVRSACRRHSECGQGRVCHLGTCTDGSTPNCDIAGWLPHLPLGDIRHSSPQIVVAPELDLPLPGYQTFRRANENRDTMVFVGANDGMLHAFVVAELDGAPPRDGDESWTFVPSAVLPKLPELRLGRAELVDATTHVDDILLRVDGSGAESWATVLLGGLRAGGQSYYALDVTDPHEPRLLWEIGSWTPGFEAMGETYGEPETGVVVIDDGNGPTRRAVAILTSGLSPTGRVWVVDLTDGSLLRTFETIAGEPLPLVSGSPRGFNGVPGTALSRAYLGDSWGRLLALSFVGADPASWTLDVAFDPAAAGVEESDGVFIRPAIAIDRNGQLVIVYGTGDVAELSAWSGDRFVASLTETVRTTSSGATTLDWELNWIEVFDEPGEKLSGRPVIYDSAAFFPTFVPGSSGACDFGHARLWSADFQRDDGGGGPLATRDLRVDGNPDVDLFADFEPGSAIFGVDVATRPPCVAPLDDSAPVGSVAHKGQPPQLIVQTSGVGVPPGTDLLGDGSAPPPNSAANTVRIRLPVPRTQLRVRSWGAVYQ